MLEFPFVVLICNRIVDVNTDGGVVMCQCYGNNKVMKNFISALRQHCDYIECIYSVAVLHKTIRKSHLHGVEVPFSLCIKHSSAVHLFKNKYFFKILITQLEISLDYSEFTLLRSNLNIMIWLISVIKRLDVVRAKSRLTQNAP